MSAAHSDRTLSWACTLAAAALLAVLAWPMLAGKIYVLNDLEYQYLPHRFFYKECLDSGEAFAWNPRTVCGYYVHGESLVGAHHPLHLLLYGVLPLDWAFNIELFVNYPFMLLGMFLFLRRWKLPKHAALFGAIAFTFSGYNLLHAIHINSLEVVAHIPWLLLCIDVAMRSARRAAVNGAVLGVALLTASQVLSGHPQSVYFSSLAEGLYALLLAYVAWSENVFEKCGTAALGCRIAASQTRPEMPRGAQALDHAVGRRLLLLVAAKALALLLGAIQLLPTLDLMRDTNRMAPGPEFRYFFSLHPGNLVQFIGPYFFQGYVGMNVEGPKQPHEAGLYCGVVATLLLVWAATRLRRAARSEDANARGQTLLASGGMALAALALVLALGRYGLLYRGVSQLPLIKAFRTPSRHIVLVHLGVAVAAAVAFAQLSKVDRKQDIVAWRRLWPMAVPALVGWTVAGAILASRWGIVSGVVPDSMSPFLTSWKEVLISPVLLSIGTMLLLLAGRGRRAALIALVVFAAIDQGAYGIRYLRTAPPITLAAFMDSIHMPPETDGYRVYAPLNNHLIMKGVDNCSGYVAVDLERRLIYDYNHVNVLRLAGVRWANNSWPTRGSPLEWTEIAEPLPRVRLVSKVVVSANPSEDIETTDLATTALVPEPLDVPEGEPGRATLIERRPGRLRIRTDCGSRQLLVVSESYHRGWRARVDGAARPIHRVYGDFMGCVVEPGTHEVVLRFQPRSLSAGRRLTCLGLVLALLFPVLTRRLV